MIAKEPDDLTQRARDLLAGRYKVMAERARFDGGFDTEKRLLRIASLIKLGGKYRIAVRAIAMSLKALDDALLRPKDLSGIEVTDEMVEAGAKAAWFRYRTHLDDETFKRALLGDTAHLDEYDLEMWLSTLSEWPDGAGGQGGAEGMRKCARAAIEAAFAATSK